VSIDAYTCINGLDTEFVINYLKEAFGITEIEKNFVKRGLRYLELETVIKD